MVVVALRVARDDTVHRARGRRSLIVVEGTAHERVGVREASSRIRAAAGIALHPAHLAVVAATKPFLEMGSFLVQACAGEAHFIETRCMRFGGDSLFELGVRHRFRVE